MMFCKMTEELIFDVDREAFEANPLFAKLTRRRDEDDEDDEAESPEFVRLFVPSHVELCNSCEGKGSSSAYLGAFSGRRLQEARDDEEFWGDYTSGRLDRPCETCGGAGRIKVPNYDLPSFPEVLKKLIAQQDDDDASDASMRRAEYLAEGGWREEGWFDRD